MVLFCEIFVYVCIFFIGALFGSFFSLATYRLPKKEDIIATRSYCPKCKHELNFFDLLPVLSYICCLGRCKYCKEKISKIYILLEACNGTLFLVFFIFLTSILGFSVKSLAIFMVIAIVYAVIFVIVGSCIRSKFVINNDINSNGNATCNAINSKLSSKSGVFLTELIIAIVLFVILLSTSIIVRRNYIGKVNDTKMRSNAVAIAVKNIELSLATDYDLLNSYTSVEKIDNADYSVSVEVTKYSDEDATKEDLVKKILVSVKYGKDTNMQEFRLNTVKGKV